MTFEKYLEELGDVGRPLTTSRLTRLANLSPEEQSQLAQAWQKIPAPRKERLVRLLVDIAEDNVELDFEGIFRLCLDDPDPAIRVMGIAGLFECTERWLMERLIQMVRDDESEEVRAAAVEALGRFALQIELGELSERYADQVDETLASVFANESETPNVRRKAIESLGVRSTEKASAAIRQAYGSNQLEMRLGAVLAMGRSADPQWINTIVHELASGDPEMRYEAATALGEIEDERAVPYLVPLLGDDDIQVRIAAITALGHIGGPRAKEALLRIRNSPEEQMREAAEEALEEIAFSQDPSSFGFEDDNDR